jgi:lactoylglutathione lyase
VRIEHIALWTDDLKRSVDFYSRYFAATPGAPYVNSKKGFESVFLTLSGGTRIEVMSTTTLHPVEIEAGAQRMGLTHFAIAVGSDAIVDQLTQRLKDDGYPVLDGPRRAGDGYYESVVLDADGNRIEITS